MNFNTQKMVYCIFLSIFKSALYTFSVKQQPFLVFSPRLSCCLNVVIIDRFTDMVAILN